MPLWDKVKQELDRAGRAAQGALDEGKLRLELIRVRQLADRAAQTLGFAIYRARTAGGDLDAESYQRLATALAGHEAEAVRLEARLAEVTGGRGASADTQAPADTAGAAAGDAGATAPNAAATGSPGGQADASMPPVNPT